MWVKVNQLGYKKLKKDFIRQPFISSCLLYIFKFLSSALQRRPFLSLPLSSCVLCMNNAETINHPERRTEKPKTNIPMQVGCIFKQPSLYYIFRCTESAHS